MKVNKETCPLVMDSPQGKVFSPGSWGGLQVSYSEYSEKLDFSPLLEGLPNDVCHCPHWGYILDGELHINYLDGSEEVLKKGDIFYLPEGHGGWVEKGTVLLAFSPEKEAKEVDDHMARKMAG
jgi:hypothetical protein